MLIITKIFSRLSNVSWLLQNCRKNPLRYLVCSTILKLRWRFRDGGILIAGAEAIYLSILADAGRDPEKPIEFYMQELSQWRELAEHWERKTRELITPARTRALGLDANNPFWEQIISQSGSYILSYALVRELKPKVIVETGTAYGHGKRSARSLTVNLFAMRRSFVVT